MINNSTLVNNTDRIYGEQEALKPVNRNEFVDTEPEWSVWLKVVALILLTYGLIAAWYAMS